MTNEESSIILIQRKINLLCYRKTLWHLIFRRTAYRNEMVINPEPNNKSKILRDWKNFHTTFLRRLKIQNKFVVSKL